MNNLSNLEFSIFVISTIGSIIGFLITFRLLQIIGEANHFWKHKYMVNAMALGYIFPMMVDVATKNHILAVTIPMIAICAPILWGIKNLQLYEKLEISITTLMSVTMSIMLVDMSQVRVLVSILFMVILIESSLFIAILRNEKSTV